MNDLADSVAELDTRVTEVAKAMGDIARAVVGLGDLINSLTSELARVEKRLAGQIALSGALTQANPPIFGGGANGGLVWGQGATPLNNGFNQEAVKMPTTAEHLKNQYEKEQLKTRIDFLDKTLEHAKNLKWN